MHPFSRHPSDGNSYHQRFSQRLRPGPYDPHKKYETSRKTRFHSKFGNFILLGTILLDAEVTDTSTPIDDHPCLERKLCVAACPVDAMSLDGHFNFSACSTHNYREFMGGVTDWVENIADSSSAKRYRQKVTDAESSSMWQSLLFEANDKAAYCMAVCPAGEDVISPFTTTRKKIVAT